MTLGSVSRERRRHYRARRRVLTLCLTAIFPTVLIAACSKSSTTGSTPTSGNAAPATVDKLVVGLADFSNASFDPFAPSSPGLPYLEALFNDLVGVNNTATALSKQTGIAQDWTVSSDGLQITFTLRPVTFSDGTPVTSADVAFSIGRNNDPTVGTPFAATVKDLVKSIATPDAQTVVIALTKPMSDEFLHLMSSIGGESEGRIVPKDYGSAGKDAFANHPIGSGPYTLTSYSPGQDIVLTARPSYFAGVPRVHQLEFQLIAADSARLAALQSGTIDFASISRTQVAAAQQSGLKIYTKKTGDQVLLFTPWDGLSHDPIISNPMIREALSLAINREEMNKGLLADVGKPSGSFVTSAALGYKAIPADPYDPVKARQLLKDSGVPLSQIDINLFGFTQSGWSETPRMAEAIVGYWQAIGVKAHITSGTFQSFRKQWVGRTIHGQALALEPMPGDTLAAPLMNITMTCNGTVAIGCEPQLDTAISAVNAAASDSDLVASIQNAQQIAAADRVYIGLLEVATTYAGDSKVPAGYSPGVTPEQSINTGGLVFGK